TPNLRPDTSTLSLHDAHPLSDVTEEEWGPAKRKTITVTLKYGADRAAAFRGLRRVSRPGRRVYVRHTEIPRVLSGLGVSILSTRSEEHTSELQSRENLVCRLL